MQFSRLATLASVAAIAQACTQCVHPGNFTGSVSQWFSPTGICTDVLPAYAAAIPVSFWIPHDQSPCLMTIDVTNPTTGKTIVASVAARFPDAVGNGILLTVPALAALSPDANPNHGPTVVNWTFTQFN